MKNNMLKKSHALGIGISLLLIVSMFSTIVLAERNEIKSDGMNTVIFNDELDQSQTQYDNMGLMIGYYYYYPAYNWTGAQSFIPQKSILTRVELFIRQTGYAMSKPYTLAIREELNGENLAVASVNHNQIPLHPPEWIEFDFEDIPVIPGETYYMVSYTESIHDNGYVWGGAHNNPYPYGYAFVSLDGGQTWQDPDDTDTCFKTYGKASDLEIGEITGGLCKICVEINNNYDSAIEDIAWSISVQGGILNRINVVTEGTLDVLDAGASEIVCTDRFIFGLGPIEITVTAESDTAGISTRISGGTVLLFFIIIQ